MADTTPESPLTKRHPESPAPNSPVRNISIGTFAALGMIVVWSSWLVISRAGAKSSINPYDLAAIRYGVASIVALPIVLYFKPWRQMTLFRMAVLTFLMGPVYVLAIFGGFEVAPASHGGIFMNGAAPPATSTQSKA